MARKIIQAATTPVRYKKSATAPDPMIDRIMEMLFGYTKAEQEVICNHHRQSMWAENIIGILLEKYLNTELSKRGWCWCPGNIIDKIDFIKKDGGKWQLLQVKTSDNSENSSSSSVRAGTTIMKWARRNSRKINTQYWNEFPDESARKVLSETKFCEFVKSSLKKSTGK